MILIQPNEKRQIKKSRSSENRNYFLRYSSHLIFLFVGKVTAVDKDEGDNARVYYYILEGNHDRSFIIDRLDGTIYTNSSLDREVRDSYNIYVKATGDPDYYSAKVGETNICCLNPKNASWNPVDLRCLNAVET